MPIIRKVFNWLEPEIVAKKLIEDWGEAGFVWLDGDGSKRGQWATLGVDPIDQICCRGLPGERNASNPFEALRNLPPGHWSGWLSYEAAAWIEPSNPWKSDEISTLWIGSHDPVLKFDLRKQKLWLEGFNKNRFQAMTEWLENISNTDENNNFLMSKQITTIPIESWEWLTQRGEFIKNVEQIQNMIQAGDFFQANLTACCITTLPESIQTLELFLRLRRYSPAPFSGIVIGSEMANNESIISTSPERFLKVLPTGEVEARPIKGTRPRNSDPQKDIDLAADLVCSSKDRAENVMIVDLLRNDLGKVCKPGSINVPQLFGLESYPHVHHLTSVINGLLEPKKTWIDLLEASWPGGSISGAPKLRACQRLYELEPVARGPYCGSLIHLNWDGTFDSNILIRSLLLKDNKLRAHAGCGIVADSNSNKEAQELNWKLLPLLKALE